MPRKPAAEYDIKAKDESAAGWRQALKTADGAGKKLTGVLKTAFAGLSVGAFANAIKGALEFGDEIGKAAVKAGIGADAMSELAFAARMSDIDIGALSTSIRKMQVELSKASTGGKEQREALDALGLSLDELKQLKADQQFEVIGDAIMRLRDPTDRARAATVLFGRAGADLLPLFQQGAAGIREAREEAQRVGAALSNEQVRLLQEGDDAIKRLGSAWDGFLAKVAVGTVKFAQAIDLMEKDAATTAKNLLTVEANRLDMMQRGQINVTAQELKAQEQKVRELRAQLETIESTYTRGGGGRRGRGKSAAPGFEKAAAGPPVIPDAFTPEMRDAIRAAEQWVITINAADSSTRKFLEGSMEDLPEAFDDLPEPILKLSESLIQADELQKEFTRSTFRNFSDLFMAAGKGADEFGDALINSFKRIVSDRATLELFEMLSGLGSSLTGKSGGKGFLGFIGSGLTSLFGLATGTNFVPRDNFPALLHRGEAVVPAQYNPAAGGAGGGSITLHVTNHFNNLRDVSDAKLAAAGSQIADVVEARLRDKRRRRQF